MNDKTLPESPPASPALSAADLHLGMGRPITRRDFVNGVAVAPLLATPSIGAAQATTASTAATTPQADYAGQSLGIAAAMHALRDGAPRPAAPPFRRGMEEVELVVVGAGLSGLTAAHLYRRHAGRAARVLLIDSMPDIGGHALRNEFTSRSGRRILGYGGSEALDSPGLWSPAAHAVIRDIGIDLAQFESYYDQGWAARHRLDQRGLYFTPELWGGAGGLVRHARGAKAAAWVDQSPLVDAARRDYVRLTSTPPDPFAGLSRTQKRERLSALTYDQLLIQMMGLHPQLTELLRGKTRAYLGAGTDACSALDAWALGLPGFDAMDLGDAPDRALSPSGRQAKAGSDEYIYHFPDGNASVARALLRQLIPQALPGTGIESLVLADRNDAMLDADGQPVRIRLQSTVFEVRHAGDPAHASAVDVSYLKHTGEPATVRARHVVLACFHRAIPLICPGLPARQVVALNDQVKVPLIYGNVLLSNWRAFARAGLSGFEVPNHLWEHIRIDMPVSIGRYRFAESPDDPVLLQLSAVVLAGERGSPAREQAAAGRRLLYGMPFADVERDIRKILQGALGSFGFDAGADIEAITLNRWAHGYAYEYMRPWDAYWPKGPLPVQAARRRWGRIAFANADAGAYAYVQGAIDQATRAVGELLPHAKLPEFWKQPGPAERLLKFKPG